ncbi:MAG: hypothetical protein WC554_11310 [Clostridia bacterium]|jgi:hypothetical protein
MAGYIGFNPLAIIPKLFGWQILAMVILGQNIISFLIVPSVEARVIKGASSKHAVQMAYVGLTRNGLPQGMVSFSALRMIGYVDPEGISATVAQTKKPSLNSVLNVVESAEADAKGKAAPDHRH